jgi:hypothetical protein
MSNPEATPLPAPRPPHDPTKGIDSKGNPVTMTRIAELRPAYLGRLYDVVMDDGRHLGGWRRVELIADINEVPILRVDFLAHTVFCEPFKIEQQIEPRDSKVHSQLEVEHTSRESHGVREHMPNDSGAEVERRMGREARALRKQIATLRTMLTDHGVTPPPVECPPDNA